MRPEKSSIIDEFLWPMYLSLADYITNHFPKNLEDDTAACALTLSIRHPLIAEGVNTTVEISIKDFINKEDKLCN